MKIALFHELDPGGARRGANEFAKALKNKGHTVDLYYIDQKKNEDERKYYSDVFFYMFTPRTWSGGNWKVKLYKDTVELYKLYVLHKRIAGDIEKKGYDFAFVHGSKFTQAPFLLGLLHILSLYYCQEPLRMIYDPLFTTLPNLHMFKKQYEQLTRYTKKVLDSRNIKKADKVLANSTYTRQNIYNAYGITAEVCHMGVDTKRFYPTVKKDTDILFIGSRDEFDGYPLFQQSIQHMQRKAKIIYLIRGETWLANDTALRDCYSRSRIVICFGYNEPFGLIPLEAMSCGSVVVALDEGGYKDSIKNNKTGILVKKDAKYIAKTLDTLLDNKAFLKQLAKNAITDMHENWQWERGAEQIVKSVENSK